MLKTLLKKQMLELTAPLRRSSATGRSRTGWRAAVFGVLAVCLVLLVMVSVGILAALLCAPLSQAGLDWLYFALMAAPALLVGVIGGGFTAYGTLYAARDNELLLSLPIPPRLILLVRMGAVWLTGTGYLALILLPVYGVYFAAGERPGAAALALMPVMMSLGCLVMAASCLLGWAVALVSVRVTRYKAVLNAVYAVALLVFAFGANYAVRQGLIHLLTNLEDVSREVRADARAVYLLGCGAAGEGRALGLLTLAGLGSLAAVWAVLSRSYLRLMTTRRSGVRAVYREKPVRQRSVRRALLAREDYRLAASTSYMVNSMLASFLLPAAAAAALWQAPQLRALLLQLPDAGWAPALICVSVCSVTSMNLITPPSVSLEGKTLWLIQSLPVTPWQALRAKLDLHLALTLPPALLAAGCLLWVLECGWGQWVTAMLVVGLDVLLMGALGLVMGVLLPNLHWTNETAAVKNGAAPMLTLFLGWLVLAGLGGFWWLTRDILGPAGALAVCGAALAAGCGGLLLWLRGKGSRRFSEL